MKIASLLALFALAVVEIACYPVKAYHEATPVMTLPGNPNITLAYVEFDDNGEMYDQHLCQLNDPKCTDRKTMIRPELEQTIARIQDLELHSVGANYVLFIHGWKNNADNTNNVAGFQVFLHQIYDYYSHSAAPGDPPAPLMGIYIGWRGASVKVGQDLTYWFRSDATLRVAGPNLEEALYRIIRAVKGPPPSAAAPNPTTTAKSNLIFIGHSFGGRVLEKVMTSYFESSLLAVDGDHPGCQATSAQKTIDSRFFPDLTVLLNEAAPATDAKQFLEFLKCHQITYDRTYPGYPDKPDLSNQPEASPLFLSITSEGDAATSIALPIGQTAERFTMKTRDYGDAADPPEIPNQSTYFTHSAANIPALHSHQVRLHGCAEGEVEVHLGSSNPAPYHFCEVPTAPMPGMPYWNHSPYWIAKIPVAIVPDHSDIFRPQLFNFLQFFLSKESLQTPRTRPLQRLNIR